MIRDPACGMTVDETRPPEVAVYRDHQYFFCSAECRVAFERNPEGYLKDTDERRKASEIASRADNR